MVTKQVLCFFVHKILMPPDFRGNSSGPAVILYLLICAPICTLKCCFCEECLARYVFHVISLGQGLGSSLCARWLGSLGTIGRDDFISVCDWWFHGVVIITNESSTVTDFKKKRSIFVIFFLCFIYQIKQKFQ